MSDPNLIPAGPSTTAARVMQQNKFKNTLADGTVVRSTAPLPAVIAENGHKAYILTIPSASMHREDGKKLPFTNCGSFGFLETNLFYDQEYLDTQIAEEHPYLAYPTPEQLQIAKMQIDPVNTIKNNLMADPAVRREMEATLRDELENKIRIEMEAKYGAGTAGDTPPTPQGAQSVTASDEKKIAGIGEPGQKTAKEILEDLHRNKLTPVSTVDLAGMSPTSGK